jgi:DNA-binding transcriptional ArsR family regulator
MHGDLPRYGRPVGSPLAHSGKSLDSTPLIRSQPNLSGLCG